MDLNGCVCVHMHNVHFCDTWHKHSYNCSLKIMFIVLFPLSFLPLCYFQLFLLYVTEILDSCLGATRDVLGDTVNVAQMR